MCIKNYLLTLDEATASTSFEKYGEPDEAKTREMSFLSQNDLDSTNVPF